VDNVAVAIPQFWANLALGALRANTVMTRLVNRDYDGTVATKGDIVNITRRGSLQVNDKLSGKQITLQTPSNQKIPVTLNKHKEVSWLIEDTASAKAITDAVNYVTDAAIAIGNEIDCDLLKLVSALENQVGSYYSALGINTILAAREKLNVLKAPTRDRYFVIAPQDETALLKLEQFTSMSWDDKNAIALQEATIGRKYGFTFLMDQNVVTTAPTGAEIGTSKRHNVAFTRDSFVLVTRPLPAPPAGSGAVSATVDEDGIAIRVTSSYSQKDGGTLWTLDVLYGVAEMNADNCGVEVITGDLTEATT